MADRGSVYGGDGLNRKQKLRISSSDQPLDSIFASVSPNSFVGSRAMFNFGAVKVSKTGNSLYHAFDLEDSVDEYLDEYFNHSEKKRRLTVDQVQFLENSFMADNKLEPERKNQLATELGLQPRQIAVWFQNRRARSRTKQVETDYELLHARYNSLKTDYDNLLKENEKLKAEVFSLKDNAFPIDEERENAEQRDTKALPRSSMANSLSFMECKDEESKFLAVAYGNEDQTSVKSDMTDVDSPPFPNGVLASLHESGNSWQVFEPEIDQSEFSQNDESLQQAYAFPKIEESYCHTQSNTWNSGFPIEDHGFGFWSY